MARIIEGAVPGITGSGASLSVYDRPVTVTVRVLPVGRDAVWPAPAGRSRPVPPGTGGRPSGAAGGSPKSSSGAAQARRMKGQYDSTRTCRRRSAPVELHLHVAVPELWAVVEAHVVGATSTSVPGNRPGRGRCGTRRRGGSGTAAAAGAPPSRRTAGRTPTSSRRAASTGSNWSSPVAPPTAPPPAARRSPTTPGSLEVDTKPTSPPAARLLPSGLAAGPPEHPAP